MKRRSSYRFAQGSGLGLAVVAALLWGLRRLRKASPQTLAPGTFEAEPKPAVASGIGQAPATRLVMSAGVPALLLTLVIGMILLGLSHSTWAINGGATVSGDVLSTVRSVRDELAAGDDAPMAVEWLDSALQPDTYGSDVLVYIKEAVSALPAEAQQARRTLRLTIDELGGAH